MRLLNDEPTLRDELTRRRLIREVGDAIVDCEPPQVFGIHGDWGMGKTSFLQQLQLYLSGSCSQYSDQEVAAALTRLPKGDRGRYESTVVVVWFEAWRYEHEQAPVVALLHEMRSQLAWYLRLQTEAKKILQVSIRGALLSLEDLTKKIGFQASKIEQAGRDWEEAHLAVALPSHTIREQLTEAIDKLLPDKGRRRRSPRLVVLIDDLDRCDPEAAYRLLEGLKIYLTLPNCVFVLGMNQRVVEEGIGKALDIKEAGARQVRASAYLEKLCQNVWRIPAVQDANGLFLSWLPDELTEIMGQAFKEALRRSQLPPKWPCVPPNPRRIKGLANLVHRLGGRMPVTGGSEFPREGLVLLTVAYIYQFHHELFRRWESEPGFYRFILGWARGFRVWEASGAEGEEPGAGQPAELQELTLFKRISLPCTITTDPRSPTPAWQVAPAYPDPEDRSVCWIQPVIHALGETRSAEFERYLRG